MRKYVKKSILKGSINKTICLISDIHFYYKYNKSIFNIILTDIKENKPDYICIPGDIIDFPNMDLKSLKPLYNFLEELGKISKVIITLGNHDLTLDHNYFYDKKYVTELRNIKNVFLLENEEYIDGDIRFIGETDNALLSHKEVGYDKEVIDEYNVLLKNIDDKKYNILLAHNPIYLVKDKVINGIKNYDKLDLILSGHTHGGILPNNLDIHFGIVSPGKRLFPKNVRGTFNKKGVTHIISNGILKFSNSAHILHKLTGLFAISIDYINIKKEI